MLSQKPVLLNEAQYGGDVLLAFAGNNVNLTKEIWASALSQLSVEHKAKE